MSTGLKILVPGVVTDPTLPKLRIDPILPQEGALSLIEPNHPANPIAAGNVTNAQVLPNIAIEQATELVPAGTSTTLGSAWSQGAGFAANTVVERSTKGGIHVVARRTANADNGNRAGKIDYGSDIRAYLGANKGHVLFGSWWGLVTRQIDLTHTSASAQHMRIGLSSTDGAWGGWGFFTNPADVIQVRPYTARRTDYRDAASRPTPAGPLHQNVRVSSQAADNALSAGQVWAMSVGTYSDDPSLIFYRAYIEDLTVSGRSYAEVDAIDRALYVEHVLTAGGRYYGDTYTAPATLD